MSTPIDGGAPIASMPAAALDAGDTSSLTAESLMIYCQTRLGSMDDEIKAMMDEQKAAIKQKQVLNELRTELADAYSIDKGGPESKAAALAAYDTAIEQLPSGDPVRTELEARRQKLSDTEVEKIVRHDDPEFSGRSQTGIRSTYEVKSTPITEENWEADVQRITDLSEQIGDNAEIQMIQLQSLMSARQTAVSLTTNMMSKLQQTEKDIVANIR